MIIDEVQEALAAAFGLRGALSPIATEKDVTFRLLTNDRSFVVKVAAVDETEADIDFQTKAMLHLEIHAPNLPIQRIVPTLTRAAYTHLAVDGRTLRVLEFVDGCLLASTERTPEVFADVGRLHAEMSVAFSGFAHPRQDRHVPWNLQALTLLRPLVDDLATTAQRTLAREVFTRFDRRIVPRLETLERQVVHGDVSPFNVIVTPDTPREVAGIIDFGDIVRSPIIFDISVPVANLLDADEQDPWIWSYPYLNGFLTNRPVAADEVELLTTTAPARLLLRALITASRAADDPERRDYLLTHGLEDWRNLEAGLNTLPRDYAAGTYTASPPEGAK